MGTQRDDDRIRVRQISQVVPVDDRWSAFS